MKQSNFLSETSQRIRLLFTISIFLMCSNPPKEGVVIEKIYEEEAVWTMDYQLNDSTYFFDTEDFILQVRGIAKNGSIYTVPFYVSESTYNKTQVGDYISFNHKTMECDDPVWKFKGGRNNGRN